METFPDKTRNRGNRVIQYLPLVTGLVLTALGIVAVMGWVFGPDTPLNLGGPYNFRVMAKALAFSFMGWALVFSSLNRPQLSRVCVGMVGITLLPSFLHYLFGFDPTSWELTNRLAERRIDLIMPPNTSLSLMVAGVALWVADKRGRKFPQFIALCGSLVAAVGMAAFLGYLIGIEDVFGWADFARLSLFNSLALSILGATLLVRSFLDAAKMEERDASDVFLMPLFLGVSVLSLVLWQALLAHEREQIRRLSRTMLNAVTVELHSALSARTSAMERMAARWLPRNGVASNISNSEDISPTGWEGDARLYVQDFPEFLFIHRAETNGVITKTISAFESEDASVSSGFASSLIPDELRREALSKGKTSLGGSTFVAGASSQFHLLTPIGGEGAPAGFYFANLNADEFFGSVFKNIFNLDYQVAIGAERGLLFASALPQEGKSRYAARGNYSLGGNIWSITVWPRRSAIQSITSPLPTVVLIAGLLMGFLLTLAVYLGRVASRRLAVTQIMNAEIEEQSRLLKLTNNELEAFSYSVSHDLRAPLRSIEGFSQVLTSRYERVMDAQGQDYLRRIRAAAERMGSLINALLNLSRLTRAELSRDRMDLSKAAENILEEMRREDPDKPVQTHIEPGLSIEGDVRLLEEVLRNLLENAWKFTRGRDPAEIELGSTVVEGRPTFYLRDNGAGFDMEYSYRLFGAFQRLHHDSEFPGTGIGLATAQRIIHKHGGRIWAEGAVDKGATIYFSVPTRED